MFQSARIKLTVLYVLIALIITTFFSVQVYYGFGLEIERGLQRQRVFIQQGTIPSNVPQITFHIKPDPALLQDERQRFLIRILLTDLIMIIVSAGAGYFLAGKTLQPIKEMIDEQNRFITDASHELNTPLTSLRTTIEVNLRDKKLSTEEARKVLESNLEEVDELQTLSGELIQLAQYQKTPGQGNFEQLSLDEIIQSAVKKTSSLAKKKQISVATKIPQIALQGDKKSLIELFVILLDNAIKYSSEERSISINAAKTDGKVIITVEDNGMGIDEKDLPHIFNRFFRTDKSRSKQQVNGYGLGLSIAKRIVALHLGKISAKSTTKGDKQGATFMIELPC